MKLLLHSIATEDCVTIAAETDRSVLCVNATPTEVIAKIKRSLEQF